MTMPHLSNCGHKDDGWCLSCVKALWEEKEAAQSKMQDRSEAEAILLSINLLRAKEGSSVTIVCDNPEFGLDPNKVIVQGEHTQWKELEFTGESLKWALRSALVHHNRVSKPENLDFSWIKTGMVVHHEPMGRCRVVTISPDYIYVVVIWLIEPPTDYPSSLRKEDIYPE